MYRCEVCQACTRPGQQRLVHVIERRVPLGNGPCRGQPRNFPALEQLGAFRTEIARELSVCPKCKDRLERGDSLATLLALARDKREELAKREAASVEADQPRLTAKARQVEVVQF